MAIKATKLRQNLYQLLDSILETGKPLEVERNGQILRIAPAKAGSKFDLLEEHQALRGQPEDLLNLDWSSLWDATTAVPPKPKKRKAAG